MLPIPRSARPRPSRIVSLLLPVLLLAASPALPVQAQVGPLPAAWTDALRPVEPYSRTGVLYDRVLPLAHLERLDGSPAAPAIDRATWRQAYDELRRAALVPAGPGLETIDADARASVRAGVIPLAVLDRRFDRVRAGALADGSLRVTAGRLEVAGAAPLVEARAVAAAALAPRTYRGGEAVFALERRRLFTDDAEPPRAVEVDFADGRGLRPVQFGERIGVRYSSTGLRTLRLRLTRADGSQADARFTLRRGGPRHSQPRRHAARHRGDSLARAVRHG